MAGIVAHRVAVRSSCLHLVAAAFVEAVGKGEAAQHFADLCRGCFGLPVGPVPKGRSGDGKPKNGEAAAHHAEASLGPLLASAMQCYRPGRYLANDDVTSSPETSSVTPSAP